MNRLQIAIDGPASAGKSTVAKLIADQLNYVYCDTGAMYRVVTLYALKNKIKLDDDSSLSNLIDNIYITFKYSDHIQKVFVNGQDVTLKIRMPVVTNNVSQIAAQPIVRKKLTKKQQDIAKNGGIVMDGRDIGTTVLPDADIKIFLKASVHERALRRYIENKEKNIQTDLKSLEKEISLRDYKDSHRSISPLRCPEDAYIIDTTNLTIDQVVDKIIQIIKHKS